MTTEQEKKKLENKIRKELMWVIDNWFEYQEFENMHLGRTISREINRKEIVHLKRNIQIGLAEAIK